MFVFKFACWSKTPFPNEMSNETVTVVEVSRVLNLLGVPKN